MASMDIARAIRDLKPLAGQVVPIRTVQETRPPEEFADAFVAEVDVKSASKVIKALDSAFPKDPTLPLTHLRRFAKREILPPPLKTAIESNSIHSSVSAQTIFVLISPPLPDITTLKALLAPFAPKPTSAATNNCPITDKTIDEASSSDPPAPTIHLQPIKIPLYPPFNITQAEAWTKTLWPVVFNPAAPRSTVAPPPQTLKRVQGSIEPRAGYFLSLAREVAEEAAESGLGRGVGAVIVDPAIEAEITEAAYERGQDDTTANWDEAVLAVAGDARYSRSEAGAPSQAQLHGDMAQNTAIKTYNSDIEGGPELHALMRAVDLIARWRREHDSPDGIPVPTAPPRPSVSEQGQQQPELPARLSAFESHFLYRRRPHLSNPPHSPSSPLKRKHEEPNPESVLTIDVSADPSLHPHHQPLPGPPLSSTASSTSPSNSTTRTIRTRSQGGYLCTDLDIYLSHEPCLCCSMGMLLSRFRAVIFPRRGRMASGGLASEPIVAPFTDELDQAASAGTPPVDENHKRQYYGLHWRKELNWRALGFEFVEDEDGETCDEAQMPVFHA